MRPDDFEPGICITPIGFPTFPVVIYAEAFPVPVRIETLPDHSLRNEYLLVVAVDYPIIFCTALRGSTEVGISINANDYRFKRISPEFIEKANIKMPKGYKRHIQARSPRSRRAR